jgi:S-adenosylmethionine:tRNA ribosyltransferase-isomerase
VTVLAPPRHDFVVPPERIATVPPERRGVSRDRVRLLVARPDREDHVRFDALPRFLRAGDLLVVNTSATRPAAIDGVLDGRPVVAHLSAQLPDGAWIVELRGPGGTTPVLDAAGGDLVALAGGAWVQLQLPAVARTSGTGVRLWQARIVAPEGDVDDHMVAHGRPVSYSGRHWPLDDHQPVFAQHPGSAEMASAGRPFTDRLVTTLVTRGVTLAPVTLHAGVSSLEAHEPPGAEWFRVPDATAGLVTHTRRRGGRVIAVGTTVTRAVETVAAPDGTITGGCGWTELVLGPDRPARVVDGLLTGWHEADASHLLLLDAVAGADLVDRAYAAALSGPYLWHEFGDACLLLP